MTRNALIHQTARIMTRSRSIARTVVFPLALLLLALLLACQGNTHLTSPVISLDLRHLLPANLQRVVVDSDPSYPCERNFQISTGEVTQRFTLYWKVMDQGDSRFITAVEVNSDGPISGAVSPEASAMLGEVSVKSLDGIRHKMMPLHVTLRATKGCQTVKASTDLELRTDFSGCQKPQRPKMKLLTPVD